MKGIILAGGKGTRLYPSTLAISKQLLPVYNKPMIYYPITTLMFARIKDALLISTPDDLPIYKKLIGNGAQWGMKFQYAEQVKPRGLADAFIVGKEFIGGSSVCLVLGDNIFQGHDFPKQVDSAALDAQRGAVIFGVQVRDPERYGVVEIGEDGTPVGIEEKPKSPRSKLAVPGLYFYGNDIVEISANLKPSLRGELEITDVNRIYLERKTLRVRLLGRGTAWLDAGTHESLLQASNFIAAIEERQGMMVGCPEEVAYRMGFINAAQVLEIAHQFRDNPYGAYLKGLLS